MLSLAVGALAACSPPVEPPALDPAKLSGLERRADALDLQEHERVWERIAWTRDLESAEQLSDQTGRPIFLFSMWGELDSRC